MAQRFDLDHPVDDGSPLGGMAMLLGALGLLCTAALLPAASLGLGLVPAGVALMVAPFSLALGGLTLVMEASPRGRSQAKRGVWMSLLVCALQAALFVGGMVWAGGDLQVLLAPLS